MLTLQKYKRKPGDEDHAHTKPPKYIFLEGRTTIGRGYSNSVQLLMPWLSRQHVVVGTQPRSPRLREVAALLITIIIKLYLDIIKSGTYVPFTGVYTCKYVNKLINIVKLKYNVHGCVHTCK